MGLTHAGALAFAPIHVFSAAEYLGWLAGLLALPIGLGICLLWAQAAAIDPSEELPRVAARLLGRPVGWLVNLALAAFCLSSAAADVRITGEVLLQMMPETPLAVFAVFTLIFAAVAARLGLEVMARIATFHIRLVVFAFFVVFASLAPILEVDAFLPVLESGWPPVLSAAAAPAAHVARTALIALAAPSIAGAAAGRGSSSFRRLAGALLLGGALSWTYQFAFLSPGAAAGGGRQGEGGGAGREPVTLSIAAEAENPIEALDAFRRSVARRPFLSHVQGIFIGEDLAREGIDEVVDFLERHPEIRRSANVLVTKGGAAARVLLDAARTLRGGSGVVVTGLLEQAPEAGSIGQVRLGDFAQWLGSGEREAYAPAIELAPTLPPSVVPLPSAAPDLRGAEGMEAGTAASPWQFRLSGIAVFRGRRLAGFLEGGEALAFALVRGGAQRGSLALDRHGFEGTVEIVEVDPALRVRIEGSRLAATLEISVGARLAAASGPPRASREVEADRIERAIKARLEDEVGRMLSSLQAWGTDALGIGRQLHARHPAVWHEVQDRWPEAFARIPFSVSVRARLLAAGPVAGW